MAQFRVEMHLLRRDVFSNIGRYQCFMGGIARIGVAQVATGRWSIEFLRAGISDWSLDIG